MTSVQLNIRTSEEMIHALDQVIDQGLFRNRTEAVNEAIRMLIRRYKIMKIAERIDRIAEKNLGEGSLIEALFEIRNEEDE